MHRVLGFLVLLLPALIWGSGSYDQASQLRIRDIIPGTEQVLMIHDGGFENGGDHWAKKGGRWGAWWVGPHICAVPGVCGQNAVRLDTISGHGSHEIHDLPAYQADWLQMFSGYAWFPTSPAIRFDNTEPGVPGAQHVCIGCPVVGGDMRAYLDGFYFFGDFKPTSNQTAPGANVFYNIKGGCHSQTIDAIKGKDHAYGYTDDKGQWHSVIIAGDNLADTPIVDFAPPVLRHAAMAEALDWLVADARLGGERSAIVVDKALAALTGTDPVTLNARGYAHLLRFCQDAKKPEALAAALDAWKSSLAAKADQPHIRHLVRLYSGFVPAKPFTPAKPPAEAANATAATGISAEGHFDPGSFVRLRECCPGTERTTLVPGGDFSSGTWAGLGQGLSVGKPGAVQCRRKNPALWWDEVLMVAMPLPTAATEIHSTPIALEAGTEYVISAWITPLFDDTNYLDTLAIGFAGGEHVWWGFSGDYDNNHAQEGLFLWGSFVADKSGSQPLRIRVGPTTGKAWATVAGAGVSMLIDNVAVTRACDFRPPQLRGSAQWAFRTLNETELAPKQGLGLKPGHYATLLEQLKAAATAPDLNRRAAANMVEFLRDPGQASLLQQALTSWQDSLRLDAKQPDVSLMLSTWKNYRAPTNQAPMKFLAR